MINFCVSINIQNEIIQTVIKSVIHLNPTDTQVKKVSGRRSTYASSKNGKCSRKGMPWKILNFYKYPVFYINH